MKNKHIQFVFLFLSMLALLLQACVLNFKIKEKDGDLDAQSDLDDTVDLPDDSIGDLPLDDGSDVPESCGNGVTETEFGEECDDGANGDDTDGCRDNCRFTCHDDAECQDGSMCNGEETCNMSDHTCLDGESMADGSVCGEDPRSICLGGTCEESVCGDGYVDRGGGESCEPPDTGSCGPSCQILCEDDNDCPDDGDDCNGQEYCETELGVCAQQNPLDDGTECGEDPRMICLSWTCQESACGDGFVDLGGGEECEDGNAVEGDGCDNDCVFSCRIDPECADPYGCTNDHCDPATHTCQNLIKPMGELCRLTAGPCDQAEYCDGINPACPSDTFLGSSTVCRSAAGICDVAEACSGGAASCPADVYLPTSQECRASTLACDPPEYCTGDSELCPTDVYECACSSDPECPDDGNPCNGDEYCNTGEGQCARRDVPADGEVCGASPRMICLSESCVESLCGDGFPDTGGGETCDDGNDLDGDGCDNDCTYSCTSDAQCVDTHACTENVCDPTFHRCEHPLTEVGVVCRAAAGACDAEEACDGLTPDCPTNAFLSSSTLCRASTGDCDAEEFCTGSSASCPTNAYHPSTTLCRPAAGACDVEEYCSGSSATCPTNSFYPSGTMCRSASGLCDAAETCTGTSATCPANGYLPSSTVCRSSTAGCDPAETCTGTSATCPADVNNCACTTDDDCPDDGNICNGEEYCNTSVWDCDRRNVPADGTVCGTSPRRICLAESCQASVCGDSYPDTGGGEECDDGNDVSGDGCEDDCTYSCHSDAECADSYSCTTDRCDPVLHRCTNTIKSSGTVCRTAVGDCDAVETCDGTNPACPADAFLPSSTMCRPASGVCDVAEYCTGTSPSCPADAGLTYAYETPGAATSSSSTALHPAGHAVDGLVDTFWRSSSSTPPQWIYFDLGTVKCINGIRAVFRSSYLPITMNIQVSDNASTWTTVVTGWTASSSGTWLSMPFTATTGRYLRLYQTSFVGSGNCNEIEIRTASP